MTKTEAAAILANYITVKARKLGRTKVDRDFIEEMRGEAKHAGVEGCMTRQAAEVHPHWKTIRAAGRASQEPGTPGRRG